MDPAAISKAGRSVAGNGASRSQARVEGLLDGASLFLLPDEAAFEVLDEGQDAAVVVAECLFSHYRDEAAKFLPTAQECGELIGNAAVVLAGAFGADPGIHEPAERGQDINWWGDAAPHRPTLPGVGNLNATAPRPVLHPNVDRTSNPTLVLGRSLKPAAAAPSALLRGHDLALAGMSVRDGRPILPAERWISSGARGPPTALPGSPAPAAGSARPAADHVRRRSSPRPG